MPQVRQQAKQQPQPSAPSTHHSPFPSHPPPPALEIRDGAIDMLIYAYKALLPKLGGYLSDAGRVHLPRTELLLREVAAYEDEIFERRRRREEGRERAIKAKQAAESGVIDQNAFGGLYPPRDPQQKQVCVLQHTHKDRHSPPLATTHHSPPTTHHSQVLRRDVFPIHPVVHQPARGPQLRRRPLRLPRRR